MASLIIATLLLASSHAASVQETTVVTPLQKVIQMLDSMQVKGKKEKHEEEVAFSAFHEWCDQTRAETKKNIAEAAAAIEQLEADIVKAEADAAELVEEIKESDKMIEKKEG